MPIFNPVEEDFVPQMVKDAIESGSEEIIVRKEDNGTWTVAIAEN
ncbi:hypothetical protein SNR37_003155 [Agarivorans aestuarii]|uniref:Uncharacterized protein n=1 Tax=Agarivorans aestuarii TaxID=1563703 RepID=A0ABU7G2U9_9ALTE|nr:hypothetical protein [Agarivorans aestuarii]MEE1673728.1 hypothetical protein [Agarivorans aestuarii]